MGEWGKSPCAQWSEVASPELPSLLGAPSGHLHTTPRLSLSPREKAAPVSLFINFHVEEVFPEHLLQTWGNLLAAPAQPTLATKDSDVEWWEEPRAGLSQWLSGKESAYQSRRDRFDPWSRKISHAAGYLSPGTTTMKACLLQSPGPATREAWASQLKREGPLLTAKEKAPAARKTQHSQILNEIIFKKPKSFLSDTWTCAHIPAQGQVWKVRASCSHLAAPAPEGAGPGSGLPAQGASLEAPTGRPRRCPVLASGVGLCGSSHCHLTNCKLCDLTSVA